MSLPITWERAWRAIIFKFRLNPIKVYVVGEGKDKLEITFPFALVFDKNFQGEADLIFFKYKEGVLDTLSHLKKCGYAVCTHNEEVGKVLRAKNGLMLVAVVTEDDGDVELVTQNLHHFYDVRKEEVLFFVFRRVA